jgi:hypothetical protein
MNFLNIFLKFKIFLIFYFVDYSLSLCTMQQICDDIKSPDCIPQPANFTQPQTLIGPDVICPEYINKTSCCTNDQNKLLLANFNDLDRIFGSVYGGCDICAINLKRFWCHFTCHPEQHTFCKFILF